MTYRMTVSPDFTPEHISGWYIFNTWFQKTLGTGIHLELYDDFDSQRKAIEQDEIDLIYANPYDASMLIREKGFRALARPAGKSDEAIVAVSADAPVQAVEDLQPGMRLVSTADPDINMIGMILLEPADLDAASMQANMKQVDSYPLVAQKLLRGEADVGFFLKDAYRDLAQLTRRNLRTLVESQIDVIHHALLVGPALASRQDEIHDALIAMGEDARSRGVLEAMGFEAWVSISEEDVEFMIDLMDTLC